MVETAGKGAGRKPELWEAVLALVVSFGVVVLGIRLKVGMSAPLVAGAFAAGLFGSYLGYTWKDLQQGMMDGIRNSLPAVIILMLVGMVVGLWILGGAVPTMVYYGLKLLSPGMFLAAACLLCCVVSTATGTSFGTVSTVGLALMGVGEGLGVPLAMVAGAIVAGAYFGDKMSPLSDTTNVAPAMAGAELFEHVGSMMYTTIPALAVSLGLYAFLGARFAGGHVDSQAVGAITDALSKTFRIGLLALVPPLVVIALSVRRVPAIPSLSFAVAFSGVWAVLTQGADVTSVVRATMDGYISKTGTVAVDRLLTRGGLNSMMGTVALILAATALGGILERTGVLSVVIDAVLERVRSTGSLIVSVIASCYLVGIVSGNQMLAIILPGRAFKDAFAAREIHARVLSRTLEDAGTLGTVLIPWSTAGLFVYGMLKVPASAYAPYAFLNWIVPIFSVIYGYTGFAIFRTR
ncbi:MAG: Na+/H+ antiporter NhaC [Firmicutes bacterium]|nr:Na+/H+ antiporter NhaC [Bacillota bacterium]